MSQVSKDRVEWTIRQEAAANTRSTVSKPAEIDGGRHVIKSFWLSMAGASASGVVKARLRDGASDTGALKFSASLAHPAGGVAACGLSGVNIIGSPDTAATVEFDIAGGVGTEQSVFMSGYTIKNM
jgi:hypothetical protein